MFTGILDFLLTCVLMFSAGCASTYLYFTRNVKADPVEDNPPLWSFKASKHANTLHYYKVPEPRKKFKG